MITFDGERSNKIKFPEAVQMLQSTEYDIIGIKVRKSKQI